MAESQQHLNLDIKHDGSLSDFSGPGWSPLVDAVRQLHVKLIQQALILGANGTGKSHFLAAVCESFRDIGRSAIILSLKDLLHTDTQVLFSLENFDVIAIDDIDIIKDNREWQEALFHLINRTKEQEKQLLFASTKPAQNLSFSLRDLVTRLSLAPSFKVPDGQNIADRESMLQSVLNRRGWQIDDRILEHLLNEGPHRIGPMMDILLQLQPMFENLPRVKVSKSMVSNACKIIDEKTLLLELEDSNHLDDCEDDFTPYLPNK